MKSNCEKKVAVVSKCLLGLRCRYDGEIKDYGICDLLTENNFEIIGVCPEMGIGLGVPREIIRFVKRNKKVVLIQRKSGLRLRRRLERFSLEFLQKQKRVDIFVLKSRSPSCGNGDCKVFLNMRDNGFLGYSDGVFTEICKEMFPDAEYYNEESIFSALNKS
ncbi:MAG: DUF523 domain-containing protein [Deltaproteobacteria bacterium]|nr:DUF523 domain-containing protein [Deltaproteobacteria bacterium]